MQLTRLLRYLFVLTFVLASPVWGAAAFAQQQDAASTAAPAHSSARTAILLEDFSSATFPPAGWSTYARGSNATEWARYTNASASPPASARHAYGSGNHDGWLVTPRIAIPAEGAVLSFRDGGQWMEDYEYSGIHVSTTGCNPSTNTYTELAQINDTPGPKGTVVWREERVTLDLAAYAGKNICIAFVYRANFGHIWYIDDVEVQKGSVAEPSIAISESSVGVTALRGDEATRTLTISNTGEGQLYYNLAFRPDAAPAGRPAPTRSSTYTKRGQQHTVTAAAVEGPAPLSDLPVVLSGSGLLARGTAEAGHISFEASEGFSLGFIGGQQGWTTITNNTLQPAITDAEQSDGSRSLALSKHPGLNDGSTVAAFSPSFLYDNDIIRMSFDIMFTGTGGADYDVVPQAPTAGKVAARVRFNWQGQIRILDAVDGKIEYQDVRSYPVGDWNTFAIELNKLENKIDYYLNDDLIYEGSIYGADFVEQFVFSHDNYNEGESAYVDNIRIEGENSWLAADPQSGTIEPGESGDITLTFDTRYRPSASGTVSYNGVLRVLSNDPSKPEVAVPVTFTIINDPGEDEAGVIAYWRFNESTAGTSGGLGTLDTYNGTRIPADFGAGSITTNFSVNTVAGSNNENNGDLGSLVGTEVNRLFGDPAGGALAVRGQANNGKYIQFEFDASGYTNVSLSFAGRGTGTGFGSNQVSYSTNGTNFTKLGTPYDSRQAAFERYAFDLRALDGAPRAIVRITFDGATSDAGNNRIDNVRIGGSVATSVESAEETLALAIERVWPNPASGSSAQVSITLDRSGEIALDVYDVLGRRVSQVAGGNLVAGRHTLTIQTADLSAGVYFVRLVAGDRSEVQRLTIVR